MTEKCPKCGGPVVDGVCQNQSCKPIRNRPAMSDSIGGIPEISMEGPATVAQRGPLLSIQQAGMPIDHTGTIIFDNNLELFQAPGEGEAGMGATRLIDDENYRDIMTVLKESITSASELDDSQSVDTPAARTTPEVPKEAVTGRPEISMTIRLRNPVEEQHTVQKLPSRSVSVPSDSASLEKKKKKREDGYNLDSKDYQIVAKVGEGGSGVVYEADQVALKRKVAVKVLKQRRLKSGSRSRTNTKELEKRKARFLHEAHVTAKLQHPNIIPLYDLGKNHHGEVFYSMKLISETSTEGQQQSWASMVRTPAKGGSISDIERNVEIFEKVCDAMRYAHAEKVVHRDLKPDNVMVGNFGEVLVIDWGMALDLSNGKEPFTAGGTTSYMAPEMGLHYLKQSEMHKLSHKLMVALGEKRRDDFVVTVLDDGNNAAATKLLNDKTLSAEIHDICRELVRLDAEEKSLALQINYSSDIYLLGAILYEIAIGHPPHYFPQESCKSIEEKHHREFWLSSNHKIQRLVKVEDPLRLSLCNIALGALQKNPEDRFHSVDQLKEALKGFQNQVQSLRLVEQGREELAKAKDGEGYLHLLPALESFRGADTLFPLGEEGQRLQIDTACEYATRADRRKDFDAGLSILDEYVLDESKSDPAVVRVADKLRRGKKRAIRNQRLAAVGWVSAVVLPLLVWGYALYKTADLEANNKRLAQEADQLKIQTDDSKMQAAVAKKEADTAKQEADTAMADAKIAKKEAGQANQEVVTKTNELAEKDKDLTEKNAALVMVQMNLADQTEELTTKTEEVAAAKVEVDKATKEVEAAQKNLLTAQMEAADAEKLAEQLKLSSAEDNFKSFLLPIPLDLHKGNFETAIERLDKLQAGDLNPQFKNGWVEKHFEKILKVAGVQSRLGDKASVTNVALDASGRLCAIGMLDGRPALWNVNAKTGEVTPKAIDLPNQGRIASAAVSPDGKWLALALDDVRDGADFSESFWLINLDSGKRVAVPAAGSANESVVGCRQIGFAGGRQSGSPLQLVTVEELSAYNGLKQRLQVATRTINVQTNGLSVGAAKTTPIAATTRDQGRVNYVATMNVSSNQPTIAIVYATLDAEGRDKLIMETLLANSGSAGGENSFMRKAISVPRYPTAMHLDAEGSLYCGQADGQIDHYDAAQLTAKSDRSNEHESAVTVLASSKSGKLISGSQDGVLIVSDRNLKMEKRLVGQPDSLTAIAISDAETTPNGFQMATGGAAGYVRIWEPESTLHDAIIGKLSAEASHDGELRLKANNTVTCGAVDQNWLANDVPATAYGTADGRVMYFNPATMSSRDGGLTISPDAHDDDTLKLSIAAPPGSFDTSFGNFDSFGIVGQQFVLLQSDGQLFSTLIDTKTKEPSSQLNLIDATGGRSVASRFIPLLATATGQSVFFTNNPTNDREVLVWQPRNGSKSFQPTVVSNPTKQSGRIKRLSFSNDGKWLAVVREVGRTSTTGEYVTEIMSVNANVGGATRLQSTTVTNRYRVGDPAFVGFSSDSRKLVLHFHKSGVDRETWTENWTLAGNGWQQSAAKQRIDNRRVDIVDWDGSDTLVTKINKRFYLVGTDSVNEGTAFGANKARGPIEVDRGSNRGDREQLKSVRPTGDSGMQYVLFNQSLEQFDRRGKKQTGVEEIQFKNARDMRVFGDQVVVLDDDGFQLVNSKMELVTVIARRKVATKSLSLAGSRLAITYDVGGLCRIMDVSQSTAKEMGRFDNASQVRISPDSKWAACQRNGELQVFAIDEPFNQPSFTQAIEAPHWAMDWIGTNEPTLLVGKQAANGNQLSWMQFDPRVGVAANPMIQLPMVSATDGQLVEIELAPYSQKYLSIVTKANDRQKLELWAVSENMEPELMVDVEEFNSNKLNPLSVTFSEMDRENKDEIGTRLVVLSNNSLDSTSTQDTSTRVFLLGDDNRLASKENAGEPKGEISGPADAGQPESATNKVPYRIFEIEGVIEVTDGRNVIASKFSGDGRSLLEVDERGVKLLLSK